MSPTLHVSPPLIRAKRLPVWLLLRDWLLTVVAWLAIAQSMRTVLYLLYDYFSPPLFGLSRGKAPQFVEIWSPLKGFALVALCLVIWLIFWSIYGARRLRTNPLLAPPTPLSIEEHAGYLRVRQNDLAQWKSYRLAFVHFDADNHIAGISRRDLKSAVATA